MEIFVLIAVLLHITCSYIQSRRNKNINMGSNKVKLDKKLIYLMFFKDYILKPLVVATVVLCCIDPSHPWLGQMGPAIWVRYIGIAFVAFSTILKILAYRELGGNWSDQIAIYDKHSLITTGPYKYFVHPVYTSYFILTIGAFFTTGSLTLLMFGATYVVIDFIRGKQEEIELKLEFGNEYKNHKYSAPIITISSIAIGILLLSHIVGMIDEIYFLTTGKSFTLGLFLKCFLT